MKTVCSFIGAQAQIDTEKTGGKNPLVQMAQDIDIMGSHTEAELELDAMRGERVADRIEDDPRLSRQPADPDTGQEASNASGSFEAFASMFGGTVPALPPGGGA